MPELPEVQTTVDGLNRTVKDKKIVAVSTTYNSPYYKNKDEIKNPLYFKKFKKQVIGRKILDIERRAKNILIHLSGDLTILVHMKMTGYFVYNKLVPFVRLDFTLSGNKHLYLSDLRKFAKVTLIPTEEMEKSLHLKGMGPEPMSLNFKFGVFSSQLDKRPKGKIKQVLMDQKIISGIGNIYADEILWRAHIHPLSTVSKILEKNRRVLYKVLKEVLKKGIQLGGDSMSDYRNIEGEKGDFQEQHKAYKMQGKRCLKKGCSGFIERIPVNNRGTHFCQKHQRLYK